MEQENKSKMNVIRCGNTECNNIIGCSRGSLIEIKRGGRVISFRAHKHQKITIRCEKCGKKTVIKAGEKQ